MTHRNLFVAFAVAIAAIAVASLPPNAKAETHKPHRHRVAPHSAAQNERPPLTVNQRSFLDPGPVVPVGSMSRYVTQFTIFGRTTDQYFAKSLYGNEVLPAPLDVPGRPQPIYEFETPAAPQ